MAGFKRSQPGLRFAAERVAPDEMDRYEVYTVANPTTAALQPLFVASAGTAGTSEVVAAVINNRYPDYPRTIQFALAGSHGDMTGTLVLNGENQFGVAQSESFTFTAAENGGTVAGTSVFGKVTSGTLSYGTAVGVGTPSISFTAGTNSFFGLPFKIAAATDVVFMSQTQGTGAITYNGGTIAGFVDTGRHAFRPAAAVTGTSVINVWARPTYNGENEAAMANLTQAT